MTIDAPVPLRIVAVRGDQEFLADVPIEDLPRLLADPTVFLWVDASGSDTTTAERLARDVFQFHPVALEDCFGTREHPKVDGFADHLFLITHGLSAGSSGEEADIVELDVFLGHRFLFTYHEKHSRSVAAARDLVQRNQGGLLRRGPTVLLHAILDRQVDTMEDVLDRIETRIEEVEDRVLVRPLNEDLATLLSLKRRTLALRRWMSKQREVVLRLARQEFACISPHDAILFRDVYDHLQRFTDLLENHREMVTSLQETYLSVTNLRLGQIMKFLTIFTAVLMPLTVITGIYGMNFQHMPELNWRWGYPLALGLMAVTALAVLGLFRRRGWIERKGDRPTPD